MMTDDTLNFLLIMMGGTFCAVLILILFLLTMRRNLDVPYRRRVMEGELSCLATENDLDDIFRIAQSDDKTNFLVRELVAIRTKYGHDSVTVGHLTWILMKMNGEIPLNEEAPSPDVPVGSKTSS